MATGPIAVVHSAVAAAVHRSVEAIAVVHSAVAAAVVHSVEAVVAVVHSAVAAAAATSAMVVPPTAAVQGTVLTEAARSADVVKMRTSAFIIR